MNPDQPHPDDDRREAPRRPDIDSTHCPATAQSPAPILSPAKTLATCAALVIVAFSLAPFTFSIREATAARLRQAFSPDGAGPWFFPGLILHALAFAPIGMGIGSWARGDRRRAKRLFLLLVVPFAVLIEFGQMFDVWRHPHVLDLLVNVAAAAASCALYLSKDACRKALSDRYEARERKIHSLLLTLTCGALVVLLVVPAALSLTSLKHWDSQFRIAVGGEFDAPRAWLGEIRWIAIFNHPLSPGEINHLANDEAPPPRQLDESNDLAALYDFANSTGAELTAVPPDSAPPLFIIDPSSIDRTDRGLIIRQATTIESRDPPHDLFDRITRSNAFSVAVCCRPANLQQGGPARIFTWSKNASHRNVTLGQQGRNIHFRVRNDLAGSNGARPELVARDVLSDRLHVLVATYDRGVSRVYVDRGTAAARLDFHAPWVVLGMWNRPIGPFAAVMLCVMPLVIAVRVLLDKRHWPVRLASTAVIVAATVAIGWTARLLITGHRPDPETLAWLLVAVPVSAAIVNALCKPVPPARLGNS